MPWRAAAATLCALVVIAALPSRAWSRTDAERFREATALMGQERFAEAADAMVQLADDEPASSYADDALFTAGQLCEEKLGDPVRALALYDRVARDYADSRAALAASRRADSLRAALGPYRAGAEAVATFNDIRHRYAERPPAESIALMEQLLREHAGWAGEPRAVLWLAEVHHRERRLAEAAARYDEVVRRWPETDAAFDAHRGAAQVAIELERFDEAEAHIAAMTSRDDPARARAASDMLAKLRRAQARATAYWVCFVILVAVVAFLVVSLRLAAGSWHTAARGLLHAPTEAIYFAPVALVLVGAALTGHEEIAPATAIIVGGGLAIAWLSGAGLTLSSPRWRIAAHIGASALGVVATVYIALHRTRLVDLILQTVRFGPDR